MIFKKYSIENWFVKKINLQERIGFLIRFPTILMKSWQRLP